MNVKRKTFVILPLSFLLVFMPVFCCCLIDVAQAHGQQRGTVAGNHPCCNSQTKDNQPQHDSSQCDCPNHLSLQAANIVSGSLGTLFAQNHPVLHQINLLALVLPSDNPRDVSAYRIAHSPPPIFSNPYYIEFRTLRL